MSDNNTAIITLKSSDGEEFDVPREVALMSVTVRNLIEDDYDKKNIPLYNVESRVLVKVIEYCKRHCPATTTTTNSSEAMTEEEKKKQEEELEAWDKEFVNMDYDQLFIVINAANYMVVEGLMDIACRKVADRIRRLSVEEVREVFGIENDFTEEEEAELRRESEWAFQ
ncbi:SKP1-like protein 1B [Acorus calamus]|uniref:SKP1-like protein n=1 Tax=Acorus calamus TaxID=4465 RepID=A0AAV9E191_ACOCL|nr:SKP1-like protein 1B [Acorus calamus]